MELKQRFTEKVIHSGDFDSMRELVFDAINKNVNLVGANLRDANLRDASLQNVNLQGADLRDASLWSADLRNANLTYANLAGANLRGADLRNANLTYASLQNANLQDANLEGASLKGASLWFCEGNRREIKSIFISEIYPITYTSEYLQIGCKLHKIGEWWSFDDGRIEQMEGDEALDFWAENKEFIKMTIEKYPATPT